MAAQKALEMSLVAVRAGAPPLKFWELGRFGDSLAILGVPQRPQQ